MIVHRIFILFLACMILSCGCAVAADLQAFSSDGCSLFPDGNLKDRALWCDCCFTHDVAYWQGGTEEERLQADKILRECVLKRTDSKTLADLMYEGVRAGGNPAFPMWYRWGYGWDYGRGYAPLTKKELREVRDKLEEFSRKQPQDYCKADKAQ